MFEIEFVDLDERGGNTMSRNKVFCFIFGVGLLNFAIWRYGDYRVLNIEFLIQAITCDYYTIHKFGYKDQNGLKT